MLSGHEDGLVRLWDALRKRPTASARHGARGVVSAAARSDVAVTGSSDGALRAWRVDDGGLTPIGAVPLHGFVNGVEIGPDARFCVAAVGQEHRLGRWERVSRARNRFAIVRLSSDDDAVAKREEETEEEKS